ncbi:kallikrein-14-like [Maniola jurtina]|uniref:kallikrein-14-like n=1 Tax=Maniola jurtina TaxID=191418 RepID=UPI001E68D15A|nr:kallikrein-14-like [Maniola jurtina]
MQQVNFVRFEISVIFNSMLDLFFQIMLLTASTLASSEMEPFIVGGDYTDIKQYPHSVLMIVDCKDPFLCGGSVLTERIVLTAGHCIHPCKRVYDFSILLKYGHQTSEHMASTMVSKFVTHSRYDDESLANDIGMVYAEHTIELGTTVQRIAILGRHVRTPRYGYVAGWGIINSKRETATSLKHVRQTFSPGGLCRTLGFSSPGIICTGGAHEKEYPDQGDSGSALVIYDFIQIGIVSFKHPHYGLIGYTNTTYYYDWIVSTSKTIHCS